MKDSNLTTLMDNCCIEINEEFFDELHDYLMETEVDLNTINIDNLVVNGIQYLKKVDCTEEDLEKYDILKELEDGYWTLG